MAATSDSWILYDGQLVPAGEPAAGAVSRGLMYGEGVFETFRVYQVRTLLFDEHISRLKTGLNTLNIDTQACPTAQELKIQISRLLRKNELRDRDAIVRLQFFREGGRGYRPPSGSKIHYTAAASPCPDYSDRYPSLATVSIRRIPSESLPANSKFTNGINYILAAKEAAERGADDALMKTVEGWIAETTIANIFWINGGHIFTPSDDCDLLPGITRQVIVDMAERKPELQIHRGHYPIEVLREAEAVALCNSVREVLPVQRVDEQVFGTDHPVLNRLRQLYIDFRNQNLKALPLP